MHMDWDALNISFPGKGIPEETVPREEIRLDFAWFLFLDAFADSEKEMLIGELETLLNAETIAIPTHLEPFMISPILPSPDKAFLRRRLWQAQESFLSERNLRSVIKQMPRDLRAKWEE